VAESVVSAFPCDLPTIEAPIEVLFGDNAVCLFDAAADGASGNDTTRVALPKGRYVVSTQKAQRNGEYEFLVHRFSRKP
jgi:hypothetical protein